MKYSFTSPAGWIRAPFPPPQRGVYLRAPIEKPGPESASILLFDAVLPKGPLDEQLVAIMRDACEGARILKQRKPTQVNSVAFPGMSATVQLQVTTPSANAREEWRIFVLMD